MPSAQRRAIHTPPKEEHVQLALALLASQKRVLLVSKMWNHKISRPWRRQLPSNQCPLPLRQTRGFSSCITAVFSMEHVEQSLTMACWLLDMELLMALITG